MTQIFSVFTLIRVILIYTPKIQYYYFITIGIRGSGDEKWSG